MKILGLFAFVLAAGLLFQSARFGQEQSATSAPAYLVVEGPTSNGISGLALVDKDFERLASTSLGGRLEFAVSPSHERIAAAWIDLEGTRFLQVFNTTNLSPACAKMPISHYATTTIGFWNPILWIGESTLVVEFVSMPRSSAEQDFDRFYAQVFQLSRQTNQTIALHPDYSELISLPPDNTHIVGISDENAIVLNEGLDLRTVNLKTGAMGQAIEVRPKGQDGYREAPMGWCFKDDSTLLLFGFGGGVKEIQVSPELKIVRTMTLPDFPAGASVAQGAIGKDPFRSDRLLIGTDYLDKAGPVEVRASTGLTLIESKDRGLGRGFAAGKDGATLSWSDAPPVTIRIQGPSGSSDFKFDGVVGAIVPLR